MKGPWPHFHECHSQGNGRDVTYIYITDTSVFSLLEKPYYRKILKAQEKKILEGNTLKCYCSPQWHIVPMGKILFAYSYFSVFSNRYFSNQKTMTKHYFLKANSKFLKGSDFILFLMVHLLLEWYLRSSRYLNEQWKDQKETHQNVKQSVFRMWNWVTFFLLSTLLYFRKFLYYIPFITGMK